MPRDSRDYNFVKNRYLRMGKSIKGFNERSLFTTFFLHIYLITDQAEVRMNVY
jgi:hypothetical protein